MPEDSVSKIHVMRDSESLSLMDLAIQHLCSGTGQVSEPRSCGVSKKRSWGREGVVVSYRDAETQGLEKKSSATGFKKLRQWKKRTIKTRKMPYR